MALLLVSAVTATAFVHPGVLVDKEQIAAIKKQVEAKSGPMYDSYLKALNSRFGHTSYTPQGPPASGTIDCGSYSNPDHGCSAADNDGAAALTLALLWAVTGNQSYANTAIKIMDNYAIHLKNYNNSNAPLQAAWDVQKWPAAAEIIRHTGANWPDASIQRFSGMLTNIILPRIHGGSSASNGNWEISMIDGMMGIAIFNNDQALWDHAVSFWRQRIPANFYIHTDGDHPVPAPRGKTDWNGQTVFNQGLDGVCQETCRDFGHTQYSIAGTFRSAQTAFIQGIDLLAAEKTRLAATLEFHANFLLGQKAPANLCQGKPLQLKTSPTFEIGYWGLHHRLNLSLPNSKNWIAKTLRGIAEPVDSHMMVFESLMYGAPL